MAIATIKFDLSDIEDLNDFKRMLSADDAISILWELTHNKRKQLSYKLDTENWMNRYEALDMVFDEINEMVEDEGLNLEELWG